MTMTDIKLRAPLEVQRAHDLLFAVVMGEVDVLMTAEHRLVLGACLDVLCWVLRHHHSTAFAENFANLWRCIQEAGYEEVQDG